MTPPDSASAGHSSPPAGELHEILNEFATDTVTDTDAKIAYTEAQLDAYILAEMKSAFKVFFDTFEQEIDQQEFALDEAEWLSLVEVMRTSEQAAIARFGKGGNRG